MTSQKKTLSIKAFGFYHYLKEMRKKGICYLSYDDIRFSLNTGVTAAKNAIDELLEKGYIKIIVGRNDHRQFEILEDIEILSPKYSIAEFLTIRKNIYTDIINEEYPYYIRDKFSDLLKKDDLGQIRRIVNRKEFSFGALLYACFRETKIYFQEQYKIGSYFVDFYCKEHNLAIEYDEVEHKNQVGEDYEREIEIFKTEGCHFIRVAQGHELNGISRIFAYINHHK